jgi:mono/diheme cytochrome c family protein
MFSRLTRYPFVILVIAVPILGAGCSRSKPATPPVATPPKTDAVAPTVTAPIEQPAAPELQFEVGKELYTAYCAACHGETGDGNGLAARFVYPKPRNFREAKFRLVSTTNRVPSDDDLMRVLEHGMPGSAMFSFAHLPEPARRALVAHVRQLTRTGVEESLKKAAAEFGETIDPAELAVTADSKCKPASTITIPTDLLASTAESVTRGRQVYVKQGCVSCHGDTGKGDGVQDQRDDDGTPTAPRDYTRGIFKGGRETEQLYARTLLGMPGSPMPSSGNLKPDEIADLVHYLQSLSDPSAQTKVEHKRTRVVAKKAGQTLSEAIADAEWESAPSTNIVVSPLWWRPFDDPDLKIQALHDGQSLAIRVSWHDATRNEHSVKPQDFRDMTAVQFFKGGPEPFLGMGSTKGTVDFWAWAADWQADRKQYADVDTRYPNMNVDEYLFEEGGPGGGGNGGDGNGENELPHDRKHPTAKQSKDYLSGWAAGNLLSDPTRNLSASSLQAKGFGTLTMLPRPSQLVVGNGEWSDGRWTIVLRRSLTVAADAGLSLAPGEKLSVAFAVWDGEARDRDGQKLISIWHDLEIEK